MIAKVLLFFTDILQLIYCAPLLLTNLIHLIQNYGERLLSQVIGALIMIAIGGGGAFITYLILYLLPIRPVAWLLEKYAKTLLSASIETTVYRIARKLGGGLKFGGLAVPTK